MLVYFIVNDQGQNLLHIDPISTKSKPTTIARTVIHRTKVANMRLLSLDKIDGLQNSLAIIT